MRLLLGIVIGCAIGASGAVAAAQQGWLYAGIRCEAAAQAVVCVKNNGTGYGVGITRKVVVVTREDGKAVFSRRQP